MSINWTSWILQKNIESKQEELNKAAIKKKSEPISISDIENTNYLKNTIKDPKSKPIHVARAKKALGMDVSDDEQKLLDKEMRQNNTAANPPALLNRRVNQEKAMDAANKATESKKNNKINEEIKTAIKGKSLSLVAANKEEEKQRKQGGTDMPGQNMANLNRRDLYNMTTGKDIREASKQAAENKPFDSIAEQFQYDPKGAIESKKKQMGQKADTSFANFMTAAHEGDHDLAAQLLSSMPHEEIPKELHDYNPGYVHLGISPQKWPQHSPEQKASIKDLHAEIVSGKHDNNDDPEIQGISTKIKDLNTGKTAKAKVKQVQIMQNRAAEAVQPKVDQSTSRPFVAPVIPGVSAPKPKG